MERAVSIDARLCRDHRAAPRFIPMTAYTAVRPLRRPEGAPRPDDFTFVSGEIPALAADQFLLENLLLSVDPYHREYMEWGDWERGFGLEGRAIGRAIESRNPALPEGTIVFHRHGWSTHALLGPEDAHRVLVPAEGVPLSAYLGVLGGTGLTAYVGLTRIARLQPGEDLFISSAAGGVGSAAGQIAQVMGVGRILGSTGSPVKVKHLTDRLGFDVGLDYRAGDLAEQLANAAPTGVDVYFANVGRRPPTAASITAPEASPSSSQTPPPRASTCTSTTSAATTWRPRSACCATSAGSPGAERSPSTTACTTRRRPRATCTKSSARASASRDSW